jgi:hypothetical protein
MPAWTPAALSLDALDGASRVAVGNETSRGVMAWQIVKRPQGRVSKRGQRQWAGKKGGYSSISSSDDCS